MRKLYKDTGYKGDEIEKYWDTKQLRYTGTGDTKVLWYKDKEVHRYSDTIIRRIDKADGNGFDPIYSGMKTLIQLLAKLNKKKHGLF